MVENARGKIMKNKTLAILAYIVCSIIPAGVYGLVAFFAVYRNLAGGVMLYAYLWNIAFIVATLVLDKVVNDVLPSKKLVITSKNHIIVMAVHLLGLIPLKTALYIFYTFVLVVSRISILEPNLIGDVFGNFVLSIEYCLIFVVVVDRFLEYILKDDQGAALFGRFKNFANTKRDMKK